MHVDDTMAHGMTYVRCIPLPQRLHDELNNTLFPFIEQATNIPYKYTLVTVTTIHLRARRTT
jgi:hypothetical protein